MKVAVHDCEDTKYPNLALMKLSAWHKSQGDTVDPWNVLGGDYDRVYSSKVFTWTEQDKYLPKHTEYGGTGNNIKKGLPEAVEHVCPDYDLYGVKYSMGFLTRGCIRNCEWCFVPEKEGKLRAHADIDEFIQHKDVVLMDNNVLASRHGIEQIEKMARMELRVDFNQGLDARLIDDGMARRLAKLKWLNPIRLACDTITQIDSIRKAVELLRWNNATPRRYFCYVLVNDVADALERVRVLKGLNVDPFCQPYRNKEGDPPTQEQKHLARWCNMKAEYNTSTFQEYLERKKKTA